jgi:hypothetical protein
MTRKLPNIDRANSLIKRDRTEFRNFVTNVITDTFIYSFNPTTIQLDGTGKLFTLNLLDKRFIVDILEVDNVKDYIDVYLFGVTQPQDRYEVVVDDTDIIITFTVDITRLPADVIRTDFEIKGKIAEIV